MAPLYSLIAIDTPLRIFDIGAAEFDENRRFFNITAAGKAHVVGFEANLQEHARLLRNYSNNEMYSFLPYVIADGETHEFKICRLSGCSSLLEPNLEEASRFHSFGEWMEVVAREPVKTVRLDALRECGKADLIKLDIQGAELMALQNAAAKLATCLVIECEVEFVCQYVDQPLFSEIEIFLRKKGFSFNSFRGYGSRFIKPAADSRSDLAPCSQWLWSDALFIRNRLAWADLSTADLKKMAIILADIYGVIDYAIAALDVVDAREGTELASLAAAQFPGVCLRQ